MDGNTVLHLAVIEGEASLFLEMINYIKSNPEVNNEGYLINVKNKEGNSILHEAYIYERGSIIETLLK